MGLRLVGYLRSGRGGDQPPQVNPPPALCQPPLRRLPAFRPTAQVSGSHGQLSAFRRASRDAQHVPKSVTLTRSCRASVGSLRVTSHSPPAALMITYDGSRGPPPSSY